MINVDVYTKGAKAWSWHFLSVYPITMTLGFIVAFLTIAYFWRRQKYSWESLQILLIVVVPSSILGARTWYLLFPPEGVTADWSSFFRFEGLAIQGGVMSASIAGSITVYFMRDTINYRIAFGILLPAIMIGQAIGRWGNFANHEVFGRALGAERDDWSQWIMPGTGRVQVADGYIYHLRMPISYYETLNGDSLNWLTFIKHQMLIDVDGKIAYRQPFFFYESMINTFGYILLSWTLTRKNWFKPGVPGALYFIWYGVTRMIMEPLRDNSDIMKIGSADLSLIFSILWIVFGVGMFIWFQGFTKPFDKWFIKLTKSLNLNKWLNRVIVTEYEVITPIKPRKIAFLGEEVNYVHRWFWFFGPKRENRVRIWLRSQGRAWTKREINQGHKNKK